MQKNGKDQITLGFKHYWEYWVNPDGSLRYVSPDCEDITGYTSNQFIDIPFLFQDIIFPEDKELWAEHNRNVQKMPGLNEIQLRIQKRNGEIRWIEHSCQPVIDEQGSFFGYHASNRDITERKQLEDQLLINQRAVDAANDGIIIIDSARPGYPITYANIAFYFITQYTPSSVMGKTPYFLEGPGTNPGFKKRFRAAITKGKFFTGEVLHYRRDGTTFWNEIAMSPIFNRDEKLTHFIIIHKDITKRKQVEKTLYWRDEILQAVAFAAERLHRMSDLEQGLKDVIERLGTVTKVSRVYLSNIQIDGFSPSPVLGLCEWNADGIQSRLEIDERKNYQIATGWFECWIKKLCQNKPVYGLVKNFSKKERAILDTKGIQSILIIPIFVDKKLWGLIGFDVCTDEKIWTGIEIETLKMAANLIGAAIEHRWIEDELRQSHKMEAIGLLVGGIAHDFNNILTAIMGYSDVLNNEIQNDDPLKSYVLEIVDSSAKAANLVKGLLSFSRKQTMMASPVNLNQIIRDSEILLLQLIDEEIELKINLFKKDLIIEADSGQIEQMLINLIVNAGDAIKDKGRITIKTGLVNPDEKVVEIKGEHRSEQYALLTLTDTGVGIDEAIIEKIFEPFFTTKEIGKGTGVGLSIVYGIIRQHQGSIRVESRLGKGTTFKLYFPISNNFVLKSDTTLSLPAPDENVRETILIAEDDAGVRKLMRNTLENAGYTVISTKDGQDAINSFKRNKDEIDLLITDAIMPKKNGKELYDAIIKIRPDIKVLFISGYAGDVIKSKGIDDEAVNFMAKPFIPGTLLYTIRKLLDSKNVVN